MSKSASSTPSLQESLKPQPEKDVEKSAVAATQPDDTLAASQPEESVSPWHPSQFPDGGKDAWLCLLGVSNLVLHIW
jgi:hypothetical protein